MENDINDLSQFQKDLQPQIQQTEHIQTPSEQIGKEAARFGSSIQKSQTEALVLAYAASLPVLQPPPKIEAATPSVGTNVHIGAENRTIHTHPQTHPQNLLHLETRKNHSIHTKEKTIPLQDGNQLAEHILTLMLRQIRQPEPTDTKERESLLLMLSALALEMLYLAVDEKMKGEDLQSLLSTPENSRQIDEHIKPMANNLLAFMEKYLPTAEKARKEATRQLIETINNHPTLASLFQKMELLIQRLVRNDLSKDNALNLQEIGAFLEQFSQEPAENAIIQTIWQTYSKNFSEFAERMQSNDVKAWVSEIASKGAQSATEYYAFILAKSTMQTGKNQTALMERFTEAFDQWVTEPNREIAATTPSIIEYPHSRFIAGCMVCGVDIVKEKIEELTGSFQHQLKDSPIADVLFAIAMPPTIPLDYLAAAALIAALLNNGIVYKATEDALQEGKTKNTPPRDLDFAIQYAKQIIAIVTRKRASSSLANKEIQERDRIICLMLTVMALNMLYRAAYGGMTGEEFGYILKGQTTDIHDKIKPLIEQLATLIKLNLPQSEKIAADTIVRLMDYVDSKDSIESMLQSTRVLANVLSTTKDLDQKRWEMQSG